jgi:SAM-dependent methyltransferase
MQAYTAGFAPVYSARWGGFATTVAPHIQAYYEGQPIGQRNKTLLDVCCGTGQLARHFLDNGYRVVGLDASQAMLDQAVRNVSDYMLSVQARFIHGDASNFTLGEQFGLVVSTYDALNHLDNMDALRNCFRCVMASTVDEGVFVFDLNTRLGLQGWNSIAIEDTQDMMLVSRGIYDEAAGRATIHITGFVRAAEGQYDRFEEITFNTLFDVARVKEALLEVGWRAVHFARIKDLAAPLDDPESERRVFIVAQK